MSADLAWVIAATAQWLVRAYPASGGALAGTLAEVQARQAVTVAAWLRYPTSLDTGLLGVSKPPYTTWEWKDLGVRIGGPDFRVLSDGRIIAAVRLYVADDLVPVEIPFVRAFGSRDRERERRRPPHVMGDTAGQRAARPLRQCRGPRVRRGPFHARDAA